ncbi:MAG TPA: T9SS type A sorting domain-containing protein [bacterium]|jgi:hypothetical protein
MKLCLSLTLLLLLAAQALPQPPQTQWSHTYGGYNEEWLQAAQQTADGGYILAGHTHSYGAGGADFWIVKTDAQGTSQWTRTFGGAGLDECWAIQQTFDGGYVLAGMTSSYGAGSNDFWLIKTDADGLMQWNHTYGGNNDDGAKSVEQTPDGGYIVAGYTHSYGSGGGDVWLVKTDAVGTMQWNRAYGGYNEDECHAVHAMPDGYALGGFTLSYGAGMDDFWLIKTDLSGNMVWNHVYGGSASERCWDMKPTRDGGFIMTGESMSFTSGAKDFWLVKTDPSGLMQWQRHFGGGVNEWATSVIEPANGGYAVGGWTQSYGGGDLDMWLVRTDYNGSMLWNRFYGGYGQDEIQALQQTSDGGYMLAGWTYSYGAGSGDLWLVKLAADQTLPVELSAFDAVVVGSAVDVRFSTASETDVASFEIWRGEAADGPFSKLTDLASQGNSTTQQNYHFTDQTVAEGQTYWYYLVNVDANGARTEHREQIASATVQGAAVISEYSLSAYPNPFNPNTSLTFTLPEASRVNLSVFDCTGRLVSDLANASFAAGEHRLNFNGANLPTGVYLVRLNAGTTVLTHKLLLVK